MIDCFSLLPLPIRPYQAVVTPPKAGSYGTGGGKTYFLLTIIEAPL